MSDRGASEASFERLRQEPFFEVVVDLVAGYLATAFDDPKSVAGEKWTLSCLPTTNEKAGMTRLFSLDVGPLEVVYVDQYTEDGETVDYRTVMVTSTSALVRQLGCPLDELLLRYPLLRFRPVEDASAGGDAVAIDWFLSDEAPTISSSRCHSTSPPSDLWQRCWPITPTARAPGPTTDGSRSMCSTRWKTMTEIPAIDVLFRMQVKSTR